MDGTVARDLSEGTFSVVCRSSEGIFLGASCIKYRGVSDPATLEALACRETLALATDLHLARVVIASDCQGVVRDIQNRTGGMYAPIVKEINERTTNFQQCSFIFEGQETNVEAHSLGKHAFGQGSGRHVWLINPPNIDCIPMNIVFE